MHTKLENTGFNHCINDCGWHDHLQHAKDEIIFAYAENDNRGIISYKEKKTPSFVLFRKTTGVRPKLIESQLFHILKRYNNDIENGSIIVLTDTHVRVRKLPIG